MASEGTGVAELVEAIEKYRSYLEQNELSDRASHRKLARAHCGDVARCALRTGWFSQYLREGEAARYAAEVAEHKRDPYSLVEEIVNELGKAGMSQIDHLGIAVKSLAQAMKFYEQLGLNPMPEETVEAGEGAAGDVLMIMEMIFY